jgi:hypothetical protein
METPAGKKSISARFVVSGTPFDIPLAELENFPTSALYTAATTAVGTPRRAPDGTPIVTFARDVWAFRLLRHFIGCGELILPANETERQLLLAEAGFYGLEAAAKFILESFGAIASEGPDPAARMPAPSEGRTANNGGAPNATRPTGLRPGFSAPSRAARLRHQVSLPSVGFDKLRTDDDLEERWALPRKTFSKVFTDEDTSIRAQEYIARVAFAADSNVDATSSMPWVVRFFGEGGKAEETDGAPRGALPHWLGTPSTEKSGMYAKLSCPGLRVAVTHKDTPLRFVSDEAEFVLNFRAFTLDTLNEILDGLPVVVAGGCVLAALCTWPSVQIPPAKLLAEYLDTDAPPCQAFVATRRFTAGRRRYVRRYDDDAAADDPRTLRLQTLLERIHNLEDKLGLGRTAITGEPIEAPLPAIAADDYVLIQRVAALLRVDVSLAENGAALIWKKASTDVAPEDAGVNNIRFLRGFRAADIDLFLTTRDPDVALETILEVYRRLRRAVPPSCPIEILRSPNSVTFLPPWPYRAIQVVSRLYHSAAQVLLGFDLDCCCVAYDGKSVLALPRALRALRRGYNLVDPSRQSLTYENRLMKYARRGFTIAVPGDVDLQKSIAAVRAKLLAGLAAGAYIELRGFQLLLAALLSRLVEKGQRSRLSTILGVRSSDYGSNVRTSRNLGRHVRSLVRRGCQPPFALGSDPVAVLLTSACVYTTWGSTHVAEGAVPPVIEFQAEAPHVQDRVDRLFTGAFNPSSADWF